MQISPVQASKLLQLDQGASLPRTAIPKVLREDLVNRGAIRLQRSGPGYRMVADPEKLKSVLENHYSIRDLDSFVSLRDENERSRAKITQITGNSKALPVAPMKGLYFGVLGDAEIFIEGKSARPHSGTALFVPTSRIQSLSIHPLCIIGIENVEAFLNAGRLRLPLPSDAVTILRWNWGTEWRKWIENYSPEFLYAGDYDWAGVAIFERQVLPISPKARFLVPDNFREKLENGNAALFHSQEDRFQKYKPSGNQGAMIYETVRKCRKALEQESLIDL